MGTPSGWMPMGFPSFSSTMPLDSALARSIGGMRARLREREGVEGARKVAEGAARAVRRAGGEAVQLLWGHVSPRPDPSATPREPRARWWPPGHGCGASALAVGARGGGGHQCGQQPGRAPLGRWGGHPGLAGEVQGDQIEWTRLDSPGQIGAPFPEGKQGWTSGPEGTRIRPSRLRFPPLPLDVLEERGPGLLSRGEVGVVDEFH